MGLTSENSQIFQVSRSPDGRMDEAGCLGNTRYDFPFQLIISGRVLASIRSCTSEHLLYRSNDLNLTFIESFV
ncbi:hypothetical protein L2E82_06169 [Cichorium intybus]|uniref:Uncharacterized protein n=1 Tax=Cichorium intybus TaxID=13427 RepID=A0ACB9H8S9_CICIN|nr:hypothetical protein L2E82_06169 [Cichorium intybus]